MSCHSYKDKQHNTTWKIYKTTSPIPSFFPMGSSTSSNETVTTSGNDKVQVTLEDLELPPRRDRPSAAPPVSQLLSQAGAGVGNAGSTAAVTRPRMTEELLPGAEARGQKAFSEDGLVGTEGQQLQLLAYYAELCEDFRHYQRITREEGGLQSDGAQLLLLNGPPGTGKTRHAVSFARALGLPLLAMNPTQLGASVSSGWASSIRQEISGRDCILFWMKLINLPKMKLLLQDCGNF